MSESRDWMMREPRPPIDLQTDRPHGARVYDWLLGGKTNYVADREQAGKVLASMPTAGLASRANRAFIHRTARFLVHSAGIHQFLDVGTGIPTSPNLHEVVQGIEPTARIVYVDNDPIVLTHSRALHNSTPEGRTAYIEADATAPRDILASAELRRTLDLDRPVALNLCLLLHWIPPRFDPYEIVRTLLEPLVPGSALVVSHITKDFDEKVADLSDRFEEVGATVRPRTREEVTRFFDGLELVEPGVVPLHRWRPDPVEIGEEQALTDRDVSVWAGVALKTR